MLNLFLKLITSQCQISGDIFIENKMRFYYSSSCILTTIFKTQNNIYRIRSNLNLIHS